MKSYILKREGPEPAISYHLRVKDGFDAMKQVANLLGDEAKFQYVNPELTRVIHRGTYWYLTNHAGSGAHRQLKKERQ